MLEEYRTAETNDLWFDVLTSERQLALDRKKFGEVLDALEPRLADLHLGYKLHALAVKRA